MSDEYCTECNTRLQEHERNGQEILWCPMCLTTFGETSRADAPRAIGGGSYRHGTPRRYRRDGMRLR